MSRLPFDPSKMAVKKRGGDVAAGAPPSAPGLFAGPAQPARPITVSQLAAMIDTTLRTGLPAKVRVIGEVSGFNDRTHWYFNIKDAEAVISCVMFASAAKAGRFRPDAGHEVVVTGRVEFFGKQGRTQFYVERIEPVGAGALDVEFKRLCEELRGLGWFSPDRKRPLPAFPRRLAVITSRTSAALQDVLNTVQRRCPAVGVVLLDVRVQGQGSAAEVVRAINWISRKHEDLGVDAVLLTRGGGSKEDLWTFNEREVAQAIVSCGVPVVAAIGHETDITIAELVSDERCATPTQAAMRLTPDTAALGEQLDSLSARLSSLMKRSMRETARRMEAAARSPVMADPRRLMNVQKGRVIDLARRLALSTRARSHRAGFMLERLSGRLEIHRPAAVYSNRIAELDRCETRLLSAMRSRLRATDVESPARRLPIAFSLDVQRQAASLDSLERALDLVGPASVLRRGYSVTLNESGAAIRSVADAKAGDRITTVVADGSIKSVVGDAPPGSAPLPARAFVDKPIRQPRRTSTRQSQRADEPGLFS
ncbi:MAG: exodeoxyribonuclease VII large subunit [Pyrinomonadaceae bacterium]|nr:exodeoxyribonuclease VII large subunit [Phycisphaerales bacterium]